MSNIVILDSTEEFIQFEEVIRSSVSHNYRGTADLEGTISYNMSPHDVPSTEAYFVEKLEIFITEPDFDFKKFNNSKFNNEEMKMRKYQRPWIFAVWIRVPERENSIYIFARVWDKVWFDFNEYCMQNAMVLRSGKCLY